MSYTSFILDFLELFFYGTHKDLMMSCLEPSAPDPTLRSCAWSLWEDRAENNQLWRGQKLPSRTSRTTKKSKNNSVIVEVYINQLFGLTDSKGAHGVRESNILLKGLCCQSSCYQRHDGADYLQVRWLEVHQSIMIHEPIVIDFLKLVLDFSERNHCLEAEVPK